MSNKKDLKIFDHSINKLRSVKTSQACWPLQIAGARNCSVIKHPKLRRSDSTCPDGSGVKGFLHEPTDPKRVEILLLRSEGRRWEKIERAMDMRQWQYLSLTDLTTLQDMLPIGEKVLLIDAKFLPELSLQPRWLHAQRHAMSTLYFISGHCDIETRIQAIQAGAKKLFIEPIDFNVLIKEIEGCIQPKADHSFRVLVIADNETKGKFTVDMLQNAAIETKILTEPQLVIDTIWGFRPDAILMMDLRITAVDYIVLTKLIREREESLAIPIIILSDDESPDKELQSLQAGADDFLSISMQSQQILETVKCRIERAQAFSNAGVCKIEVPPRELPDREAMLLRLGQVLSNGEDGDWSHGLIVVTLQPQKVDYAHQDSGNSNQFVSSVAEGVRPILQAKDYLARVGHGRLAIMICREKNIEVERLANLCFEIVKHKLDKHAVSEYDFGIGLQILDDASMSAEKYLQQGEQAADAACQQGQRGGGSYTMSPYQSDKWVMEGTGWLRDEFMRSLQDSSVSFQEHRFVCIRKGRPNAETIELIPELDFPGGPVDIYEQAALCSAAAEFDRFICEMGIRGLYENTLEGKWVRLILRQSTAVLEENDYIEFIKGIMRMLHVVGNGLVLEFSLPSLASHLREAAVLFEELKALGIGVSLSHFPCNESGYRALSYLRADVIRPRTSSLYVRSELIEQISNKIHSLEAEVILPYNENNGKVTSKWFDYADYIGADFPGESVPQADFYKNPPSKHGGNVDSRWIL